MPGPVGHRPVTVPTTTTTTPTATHEKKDLALKGSHAATVGEVVLHHAEHKLEHTLEHMKKDLVDKGMGKFKKIKKGTKAWGRHLTKLQKVRHNAKAIVAASKTAKIANVLKPAGKVLGVAGPVLNGISQYGASTATTTAGKTTNAVGAALVDGALTKAVPVVAAVDAAASFIVPKETWDKSGKGIGGNLNTSVRVITTTAEGLITGDTRGMEDFHKKSVKGDYGVVFQAASEAGDYWAQHGVVGGLKNAWKSIWGD